MSFRAPNIFFKKELLDSSRPLYLALSSGVDSIACAYYLLQNRIPFTAWHFDHRQSVQNRVMAKSAQRFCKEYDIPFKCDCTPSYDENGKLIVYETENETPNPQLVEKCNLVVVKGNKEDICRGYRMAAMQKACVGGQVIFAHHLNDCVESYCMNFMKGVPEHCPIPIQTYWSESQVTSIRPFMLTKKRDFIELCEKNDLMKHVVEDFTNTDQTIRRNWIRHTLVPTIETQVGIETVVRKKMEREYAKLVG